MRRFTALLLSFTLLTVSSLPMVSEAATCSAADYRASLQQAEPSIVVAGHERATAQSDMPLHNCRIECACGCHRSLDALPHLLAPSSLEMGAIAAVVAVVRAVDLSQPVLHAWISPLATPPPIAS